MASDRQGFFATLFARHELLSTLVGRNLTIRYKGSALGFLWSLLTPLFFILIYAAFATILKFNRGQPHYLQSLVGGIIVWQFTASCLNASLFSIIGNANLVKKVAFPRVILPASTAIADAINFLLTFLVLLLYLLLTGAADFHHAWWVLPAFLMQLVLGIGLCCLCGTLNVFFRDVQHIVGVVTQAWFFLSPAFYDVSMQLELLRDRFHWPEWLAYLNPITGILGCYRLGVMGAPGLVHAPWSPLYPALSAAVCLVVFLLGLAVLRAGDRRFGDIL